MATVQSTYSELQPIGQGGMRTNIYAMVHRFVAEAETAGYVPKIAFFSAHGEADAVTAMSQTTYYDNALDYYKMCQLVAKQALNDPNYVAPVLLTYPAQQSGGGSGDNDRAIKEAIRLLSVNNAGIYDGGSIYQYPCNTDRVHPTDAGYVLRGEWIGYQIKSPMTQPMITSVSQTGTSFTVTYNQNIQRDATLNTGTNLNTSFALDGFEWLDNGSLIKINSLVYGTNTITGTLNSTPVGSTAQQVLRYGVQTTTATLTAGYDNMAGGLVRSTDAGVVSTFDTGYTHYKWAIPQRITAT